MLIGTALIVLTWVLFIGMGLPIWGGVLVTIAAAFIILFGMTDAVVKNNDELVMQYMENFYFEGAAMIVTLITVGKLLEAISKGRTTDALKNLMHNLSLILVDGIVPIV